MTKSRSQQGVWAGRKFTRAQMLKRDIRSAATRSQKKGIKPTLPALKCLAPAADEKGESSK